MSPILQVIISAIFVVISAVNIYIVVKKSRSNQYNNRLSITRVKTINLMAKLNLKHKSSLPEYEAKNGVIRSKKTIIKRLLALYISSSYAIELKKINQLFKNKEKELKQSLLTNIGEKINKYQLQKHFSKQEANLFRKDFNLSKQKDMALVEKIAMESDGVAILAYVLSLIEYPPMPDKKNYADSVIESLEKYETVEQMENNCKIRKYDNIKGWVDIFFHLNWANQHYKNKKKETFIIEGALKSSLRAFIWLLNEKESNWFEIDTEVIK